jgi:phosphatidate cytidylyltransferase
MNLALLTVSILFLAGGIGIFFINRKLTSDLRKENWKKYFYYLLITSTVLASIIIDRRVFAGLFILINSVGLLEMMTISNKTDLASGNKKFLYSSFFVFGIILTSFSAFIQLPKEIIVFTYTVVLVFDGACQVTGQLLGKNKIAPVISPNKTREGFIYGSLIAIVTAVLIRDLVGFSIGAACMSGLVICLSSFAGDLLASLFKRKFGAKNFSHILPGQGGMFDRFDSFMTSGAIIGILGIPYLFRHGFDKDVLLYCLITVLFYGVLLTLECIYLSYRIKPEYTRLVSHILAGTTALLFLTSFSVFWYVLAMCIHFALFLYVTARNGFFVSHHQVQRKTHGSTIFFAGILGTYFASVLLSKQYLLVIPVLILTISDPLAALVGINTKAGHWTNILSGQRSPKTYAGSLAFMISSVLVLLIILPVYYDFTWQKLIIVSLVSGLLTTLAETVSSNGTDNITVPLVIDCLLLFVDYFIC